MYVPRHYQRWRAGSRHVTMRWAGVGRSTRGTTNICALRTPRRASQSGGLISARNDAVLITPILYIVLYALFYAQRCTRCVSSFDTAAKITSYDRLWCRDGGRGSKPHSNLFRVGHRVFRRVLVSEIKKKNFSRHNFTCFNVIFFNFVKLIMVIIGI